jgi:uncharacterized protein (DUF58 family)
MAFQKSFCGLGRKCRYESFIGVRQVHRQVVHPPLHSGRHHQRLAEVRLRFARLLTLVAGRHRVAKLPHRLPRYPKLQSDRTLTPALNPNRTPYTPVKLHIEHPSGVP